MKTNPIILLCGQAGSGKDTAAKLIQESIPKTEVIAQSAPLKICGERLFGFTQDQLWGPSECRNAPDPRFDNFDTWQKLRRQELTEFSGNEIMSWLKYCGIGGKIYEFHKWLDDLEAQTFKVGKSLTPRFMLQTLGTEFGRKIDPNIWSKIALQKAEDKLVTGEANLVLISDGRFRNEILSAKKANAMVVLIMTPEVNKDVDAAGVKGHASEEELKKIPLYWYDNVLLNMKQLGLGYYKELIEEFCTNTFKDQF